MKKHLAIMAVNLLLMGCSGDGPKPPANQQVQLSSECKDQSGEKLQNLGLNQSGCLTSFSTGGATKLYYHLNVKTEILKPTLEGPEAQTLLSKLKDVVLPSTRSIVVNLTVTLNGTNLPVVTPFSYSYDAPTKTWKSDFKSGIDFPWVYSPDPQNSIPFTVSFTGSDVTKANLASTVVDTVKTVGIISGAPWVLSTAAQQALDPAIQTANSAIQNFFSYTVISNAGLSLTPIGKKEKSWEIVFYDLNVTPKVPLARLTVMAELRDSMIATIYPDSNIPSNNGEAVPHFSRGIDDILAVKIFGSPSAQTLRSALADNAAYKALQVDGAIANFEQNCQLVYNELSQSFGLNPYDQAYAFEQILRTKQFEHSPALFNSNCVDEDVKSLLRDMSVPLQLNAKSIAVSSEDFYKLVAYFKSPNSTEAEFVKGKFAAAVTIADNSGADASTAKISTDVTADQAVQLMSTLGITRNGCPYRPFDQSHTGVGQYVRIGNRATVYVVNAWGSDEDESKIARIDVRPKTNDDKFPAGCTISQDK